MSIDYDRLRTTVNVVDDPETDKITRGNYTLSLEVQGPALARELLRLRDGVEVIRDRCAGLGLKAEYAPNVAGEEAYRVAEQLLTNLLNGDTE